MQRSESITQLAEALAKAQGAIENAAKDADNPYFKSKYADLASIRDAMRKPFADNGLSAPQFIRTTDPVHMGEHEEHDPDLGKAVVVQDYLGYVEVETVLLHKTGEYMSEVLRLPVWNPNPQKVGSASTYGRRYALQSVAGVAAEIDDDGNAASGKAAPKQQAPQRRDTPPRPSPQQQPAPEARQTQAAPMTAAQAGRQAEREARKPLPEAPKPQAERREALQQAMEQAPDNGGWVADEVTENLPRTKSEPPKGKNPNRPRDPGVQLAVRGLIQKLMQAAPREYPNASAVLKLYVDNAGNPVKIPTADADDAFLAKLQELVSP